MRRAFALLCLTAVPFSLALGTSVLDTPAADRIEEDWELVVASPDSSLVGPQITMTMKPSSDDSSPVMIFNLNYREQPSFSPGGLQVQVWNGSNLVATSSQGSNSFQTSNETVTWTQRMSLSGSSLSDKIVSGNSTTWGAFGQGDGDLAANAPTTLTSLGGYDPATSIAKSRPGFQSNRVTSMTLRRVRYYAGETLLSTDSTTRSVDLSQ
jgi:hypothetical protein